MIGIPWFRQAGGIEVRESPALDRFRPAFLESYHRERDGFDRIWLLPIGLGVGAILYLAAPTEPNVAAALAVLAGSIVFALTVRAHAGLFALALGLSAVAAGFCMAKARMMLVDAPIIERSITASVNGVVVEIEARAGGRMRILVRPTAIEGVRVSALPALVRVTARYAPLQAGDTVSFKAALRPPPAAPVPDGYDFARDAYFERIGGVGFAIGSVKRGPPAAVGVLEQAGQWLDRWRTSLTDRIVSVIGGDAGAVTASLVTGKRGLISDEANATLRASGLYHIISISGLHMAIFAGGVFSLIRAGLALSPGFALRRSTKRWAALAALVLAALYALFAGLAVATLRSFLMTALVLVAAALRRRAMTRRNLALAAIIVLVLTPEAVLSPGFQMSFAAVAMLIAFTDRTTTAPTGPRSAATRLLVIVAGMVGVTLIATIGTAPFAAFHFHRLTAQAVASNLVATPLVTLVIMPLSLLALVLEPFGYGDPLWSLTGRAVDLLLSIAATVAAWPGAQLIVPQFSPTSLALISIGLLALVILRTRLAILALVPIVLGTASAAMAPRPIAIVGANGYAALVRDGDGLRLIAGKRDTFLAREWLLAMGDDRAPDDPVLREGVWCDAGGCSAPLDGGRRLFVNRTLSAVEEDCGRVPVLVTQRIAPDRCREGSLVIDAAVLRGAAAVQIFAEGEGFRLVAARPLGMDRPWGRHPYPMSEAGD